MESAIVIERFTKRYGSQTAVRDLSLEVPRGSIFGLLGRNGAGKSTTIKALLDLVRPTSGRITVLGRDSVAGSLDVRRRVGYLPEQPNYYGWMRVEEILAFNAAFYATWDSGLAWSLVRELGLPPRRRLRELSRGMQAETGLVLALASRPELLILDDPTSGLDPVVRRDFLEKIIVNVQAEGGSVFFSSHVLPDMERIADRVAILHEGRLLAVDSVERLKSAVRRLRVVYPGAVPEALPLEHVLSVERNPHHLLATVARYDHGIPQRLRSSGAESVEVIDMSLEEVFIETVKGVGR